MRDAWDRYFTPVEVAERIVRRVWQNPARVLEPSCGAGAFLEAIHRVDPEGTAKVHAIDPAVLPTLHGKQQFRKTSLELFDVEFRYNLIIGNPPFSLWRDHVELAAKLLAPDGLLAFLLPSGSLHGRRRRKWWRGFRKGPLRFRGMMPLDGRVAVTLVGEPRPSPPKQDYSVFIWKRTDDMAAPVIFPHIEVP